MWDLAIRGVVHVSDHEGHDSHTEDTLTWGQARIRARI